MRIPLLNIIIIIQKGKKEFCHLKIPPTVKNGERVKSLERRNHPVLSDHPVLNGRKRRAFLPIVMQIGY